MTTGVTPSGYVRVGLEADIPMEDAHRAGAMSRHVDVQEIIRLFSEQEAGVIRIYISYSVLSMGTGKGKPAGRKAGKGK